MSLAPAPVLAALLGILHVSLYVVIRGSAGQRLPWLVLASFLGAWAGDALGTRLGTDDLLVGDFHLIAASILAWVGIAGVAIVAILGPQPGGATRLSRPAPPTMSLSRTRARRLSNERDAALTARGDLDTDRANNDPSGADNDPSGADRGDR